MRPSLFLLSVATGIRIMYCKNDCLRDYQQEMKLRLFEEWELHRSVMVQMPTGTGKTHLLAAIVREFLCGSGSRVWIVAHRRELVEQIEETVSRYGMGREDGSVRVMSIQWLSRNRKIVNGQPDLIVIDEAHHALAETYRELWKSYPEAVVGYDRYPLSAEPQEIHGYNNLFDTLITSWSIAEFIGRGWLSSFDYVSIRANSREQRLIDSLKKRGADGDYQVKEMNAVLNRETGIRQLYESVRRYAAGKKGIVYAVSIAHARQIAAYYSLHGVESVAIDSRTPALERKELVEGFQAGKDQRVRVMSIQWLSRNRKIVNGQPDLIVIDEAHHALAETYRELWKSYPEARKLGMTATPCRLNRKGFTDLFDTLITSWSIAEFIGRGWLSSFDYVSIRANSR